jgi:Na+/H+ antiporter NhaD/arsenite permease-like protein
MFVGLFVVVTGLEMTVLTPETIVAVRRLDLETTPVLSVVTAGLSNLVSNVPAVLVLKPFIANSLDPQRAWLQGGGKELPADDCLLRGIPGFDLFKLLALA